MIPETLAMPEGLNRQQTATSSSMGWVTALMERLSFAITALYLPQQVTPETQQAADRATGWHHKS